MSFYIKGTRIELSFWFFATATASSLFDTSGTMLAGLLAAATHEAGHMLCILASGAKLRALRIKPLGCELSYGECSRKWEAAIDLSGAAANLLAALAAALSAFFISEPPYYLIAANLFLGATNLLPALPLDGGQALRLMLSKRSPAHCDRLMSSISFVTATPVLALGIFVLLRSKYNFSLLSLGLWLLSSAINGIL